MLRSNMERAARDSARMRRRVAEVRTTFEWLARARERYRQIGNEPLPSNVIALLETAVAAAPDALVGMGGAVTNLTAVMLGLRVYDPEAVQGTVLTGREVDRQIELYRSRSTEERRQIVGLQPKRAEVILAGACIVRTVMRKLRKDELTVSDRGLRHGLLVDRFGG